MYRHHHHHHHHRHPLFWLGAFLFLGRMLRGRRGGWYGGPGHRGPHYL